MATNFPGSLDSFTNPTSGSTLDSPSHAAQHANINDAVEAIETALLDGAPLHIDDANERVGIGTTSPSFPLSVDIDAPATYGNAAGNFAQMWTNSGTNALGVSLGDNLGAGLITNNGYDLHLGTSGTSRVTVQSGGNVGIGTTSPAHSLDVVSPSGANNFRCHNDSGSEGFRVGATIVRSASINGITTGSAANVYIAGNNTLYRSTSSAKYKTDIETLEDDYADIVFRLRPVWYRSIAGDDPEQWSYYGLVAEEVAEVDPRLVHFGPSADCSCVEDDDGHVEHEVSCLIEPEGVQYDRLVPHLISVVQRQQAQIDALEARLAALESAVGV